MMADAMPAPGVFTKPPTRISGGGYYGGGGGGGGPDWWGNSGGGGAGNPNWQQFINAMARWNIE
jgi:hypothetical protein